MSEKPSTIMEEAKPLLNDSNPERTGGNGTVVPSGESPRRDDLVLVRETFQGCVLQVMDEGVLVQYDTGDDLVEQFYRNDQFRPGKVPACGDRIVVDVIVRALAPFEDRLTMGGFDEHKRKNVVSGNIRF